ncbi:MAG TPA: ATP-dependent helicase HrpB [Nannocystis exedens]|nr:ATP-dependent helicase HrpB [Nannocystis exedens]
MRLDLPGPRLPIDAIVEAVVGDLEEGRSLVIEAPPGAGKTTVLPLAFLAAGFADEGEILVLQPRRLAARMAAHRAAELLGERVGERVGYQVRFDSKVGPKTRVRLITEALLTRRLRDDPQLCGVAMVVLDEFHERHLSGDLALALLRRLQRGPRPELRIVVMSATLDGAAVAEFLGCARRTSAGRAFPVEVEYQAAGQASRQSSLESQVVRAFHGRVLAGIDGDTLVFLPGAREIRACSAACAGLAEGAGVEVLPLYGDLSPAEQDRAVRPGKRPKLVLSTNVAETSITIDGVTTVIDSGLCRLLRVSPWSGIPTLQVVKIARDSAAQRAGRAGRTRAGRCIRLYSRFDHDRRAAHTAPEIARLDLAGALLDLYAAGISEADDLEWLESPPEAAWAAAKLLLRRLGAISAVGELSSVGRAMLRYPLHARLARVMVEAVQRGVPDLGAGAAAILSERGLRADRGPARVDADADVLVDLVDLADLEASARMGGHAAQRFGLLPGACRQALRVRDQLRRIADGERRRGRRARPTGKRNKASRVGSSRASVEGREEQLCMALLAGFPDRVGCARGEGSERTLVLADGGSARLAESSVVRSAPWAVALVIEERRRAGMRGGEPQVRSAAAIDPEWLVDLFPEVIEEHEVLHFDSERRRVVGRSELRYGGLVIEASALQQLPPVASKILADAAIDAGVEHFVEGAEGRRRLESLATRTAFAATIDPAIPVIDAELVRSVLIELCEGLSSFAELRRAGLWAHVQARLRAAAGDRLDRIAPTHVDLPSGRRVAIHYNPDPSETPSIASRLQDFFGSEEGPRIADGRVALVLHLLAPNRRDLQVTTDLAGFWERHYPALRRALMRRYPRHAWPENPRIAPPPRPGRTRRRR